MNRRPLSLRLAFLVIALFTLLFGSQTLSTLAQNDPTSSTPQQQIEQAWQMAQASGTYQYRSLIEQTSYAAPSLINAGRAPESTQFGFQGQVDLPADSMEMTLWRDASFDPARGIAMRREGDTTYARVGTSEWQEMDNVSDLFAPSGDPLSFLAGIKNVTLVGSEERDFGDGTLTLRYTRYHFEVDGPTLGENVRNDLETQMRADGELPRGISVQVPDTYLNMTGTGDIWLNEAGLPARLVLDIQIPDSKSGSRADATITNDYWDYDANAITLGMTTFWQSPSIWLQKVMPQDGQAWLEISTWVSLVASISILGVLSLRFWRVKQFYAAVVGAVILSLLFSPLMQSGQVYAYSENVSTEQALRLAEQEAHTAEQEKIALARATQQPAWNPHRNPTSPLPTAYLNIESQMGALNAPNAAPDFQTTTTTDTDGDGLSDADEVLWGGCPSAGSTSDDCDGVTDPTDSDGDGLSDGIEVNWLHTLPSQEDSDKDGISDYLEVRGFSYNGTQWYLNPNEADSNYDGQLDSYECPVWNTVSPNYNPGGTCPDTDKDGTPDVFDTDDDGDEIEDGSDLSPLVEGGTIYSEESPLEIQLDNLTLNEPAVLNLQLRPLAGNMAHQGLVLDWPSGDDAGHIQRQLDTTFATTTNPDAQSTDAFAANGDVRLTPMLEITMPYTDGHYANLPVNSEYLGTTRTLGVAVDEWLEPEMLEDYIAEINDIDETSGDLVVYVPLGTTTSMDGDEAIGFSARMLYYPTQGVNGRATWGAAHEYRLIWMVQMLQDSCINPDDDPDTCEREDTLEIVHLYEDEYTVTGIEVSEELGTDVALLYETPTLDDNLALDDHLWNASWNLSTTFLTARDCDALVSDECQSNGDRDVTLANMASMVEEWSNSTEYVEVESFVGEYEYQFEATTASAAAITELLDETFTPYGTQTVPTVLMATEIESRNVNLGDTTAERDGNRITLDLDPDEVPATTSVGMVWQPYQYNTSSEEWETYDIDTYLEVLDENVVADEFFQAEEDTIEATEESEGKRLWAQYYYSMFFQGVTALAEIDGETLWVEDQSGIPEATWQASSLDVSLEGFTFIGGTYGEIAVSMLYAAKAGTFSSKSLWARLLSEGEQYNLGKSALFGTVLMAGLFVVAAVGLALYIAGTLSGDSTLVEIGKWVLTVTGILSTTIWIASMTIQITKALKAGIAASVGVANMMRAAASVSRSFTFISVAMVAINIGIALAFMIYALVTTDIKNNPASFYAIVAYFVATVIVNLLLLALQMIPVIGQLLYAVIAVLDIILIAMGKTSATEWVTQQLADAFWDFDAMLVMDDPDRLSFDTVGVELVDPRLGFSVSNSMIYTMAVTNTLSADPYKSHSMFPGSSDPTPWEAIKYSTFRYFLRTGSADQHEGLALYQMEDEWEKLSNRKGRIAEVVAEEIPFASAGTGINRDFGGEIYVVEAYAASYVLCFTTPLLFVPDSCSWHSQGNTNAINVGQYVEYDILPATVSEFVDVYTWNGTAFLPASAPLAFPQQSDQDGDGLLSVAMGGTDTDDMAHDSDGDGLSDVYELTIGTDPDNADSDGDGLDDKAEISAFTDPLDRDSDDDELTDYTELMEGWLYAYPGGENGAYLQTRVWSDPLNADGDMDTLSDLEEFVFGSHPQIATDPSFIKDIIRFDNMTVEEDSHLQLLARFDERANATLFTDSSGNDNNATCELAADTCPTSGVTGRYGNALQFDGTSYIDAGTTEVEMGQGDFTIAAWVNTTYNQLGIVTLSDGDTSWEQHEKSFYLNEQGSPVFEGWGNEYIRTLTEVNDGEWHHVVAVWDYDGSGTSGSSAIYVDGVNVTDSSSNYVATHNNRSTDHLRIGFGNYSVAAHPFNGSLDEVALFDAALDATEVRALYAGRYNPADLIVVPDSSFTYHATITNTHALQDASGFVTANSQFVEPLVVDASILLPFEPEEQVWEVTNGTGESTTATCLGDGSCPTFGADGRHGNAVTFDGDVDVMTIPHLGEGQATLTMGFWLNVASLPATGERATILETTRVGDGALEIYLNDTGNLVFDLEGSTTSAIYYCDTPTYCPSTPWTGDHVSDYSFAGNLGTWQHFIWIQSGTTTTLYQNANSYYDSMAAYSTLPNVLVGPGNLGNNSDGSAPFDGTLDELVFYNNESVSQTTSQSNYKPHEEIREGYYWIGTTINNVTDYLPSFLLSFNEDPPFNPTPTEFLNSEGYDLVCDSSSTCPTLTANGYDEYALSFDGSNDYLPYTDWVNEESQTITLWVKPNSLPTGSNTATLLSTNATGDAIQLYLNNQGKLVAKRNTDLHTSTATLSVGTWTKIQLVYEQTYSSGAWLYRSVLTLNDVTDSTSVYYSSSSQPNEPTIIGPGRLGNNIAGTSPFNGLIDEVTVSTLIDSDFNEGDAPEPSFINQMSGGGATFCDTTATCPTVGATGAISDALTFDGTQYLWMEETDFARGDYTIGLWFKSSAASQQTLFSATSAEMNGVLLELQSTGKVRYVHRFPAAGSGGTELLSPASYNDGQWHYATAVYEDSTLRLFVDGVEVGTLQDSAETGSTGLLDITLGRASSTSALRYFTGALDELVVIPAATDADGIAILMAGHYPAMTVANDLLSFTVPEVSSTEVSGSITVADNLPTSLHRFNEEVEAALQLSSQITFPIVDDNADDLIHFLPFEDVPGSTTFENVVQSTDMTCSGDNCPQAGVRGKVDRALLFDGADDYLHGGGSYPVVTVAAWVNADRGTIVDLRRGGTGSDYGGIRLDFNRYWLIFESGSTYYYYSLPITMPENEWSHVVGTYDSSTKIASVYVNGVLQTSQTLTSTGTSLDTRAPRIGLSKEGVDGLNGYLDDVRMYDVPLSAAEVQSLYLNSAAVLRYEFDEDGEATTYADSSIYGYSGIPSIEACVPFTLDTVAVTAATTTGNDLYAYFDGARFIQETDVGAGSSFAPARLWTVCGGEEIEVGFIDSNGTASAVGSYTISAVDVATVAAGSSSQAVAATLQSGGNSIELTGSFAPNPTYQPNPAPGTDGQIGNTALFDGSGYIEIEDATSVNSLSNNFTVIGWINPDQLVGTQQILAHGQDASTNGFAFGLTDDKLRFSAAGGTTYNGTTSLDAGVWQQVAIVFNGDNDALFYVDGILKTTVAGTSPITVNGDDPLYIGATTTTTGAFTQQFAGQIDELSVYSRSLSAEEIISIYMRELRWYRARATAYLQIDNDLPTMELLTPNNAYYADGYI